MRERFALAPAGFLRRLEPFLTCYKNEEKGQIESERPRIVFLIHGVAQTNSWDLAPVAPVPFSWMPSILSGSKGSFMASETTTPENNRWKRIAFLRVPLWNAIWADRKNFRFYFSSSSTVDAWVMTESNKLSNSPKSQWLEMVVDASGQLL